MEPRFRPTYKFEGTDSQRDMFIPLRLTTFGSHRRPDLATALGNVGDFDMESSIVCTETLVDCSCATLVVVEVDVADDAEAWRMGWAATDTC